jgi:hypothetical protein
MGDRRPAITRTRPRLAETDSSHPTPTWPSPCPPWTPQRGQRATDHHPSRRFATSLALTPLINSPSQFSSIVTVRRRPTLSVLRRLAAQRAQSEHHVPERTLLARACSTHIPARHVIADTTASLPSPEMHCGDPATTQTYRYPSEKGRLATEPARHRHRHLDPYTQPTTPSREAALAAQSHPRSPTVDRAHLSLYNLENLSGSHPLASFAPSPLPLTR